MGKSFSEFLKATLIGGLLFLVPGVLIVIILGKAMQLARRVTEPIYDALPDAVFGVGVATVISVLVLVLIAFVAGLLARTKFGKRIGASLEHSLLGGLPQYQMVKSMAQGMAQVESTDNVTPVLVSVEDAWQIGYLLEPLENGWVAAFLPQAPTPMSGNVMYLPAD
ncbi:MAG: DUF502 domain-containing protein, partial [Methyloceanibacter sp.]